MTKRTMAGGGLLLLALALAGCGGRTEAAANEELAPVVVGPENIAVVSSTTLADGPAISGTLEAERSARVNAELGGSVLQVLAEEGQQVAAGQPLAQIEPQTAREAAEFTGALVASLQNNLRLAQRNLERSKRLAAGGALSTAQMEQDELAVAQAEAQLAEARSRQTVATRTLSRTTVRAPFAGLVASRLASVGDVVRDGTQLFTIVDPRSLRLEGQVPAEYVRTLKPGTPVRFRLSGYPDPLAGRVSRVVPVLDPATRQVRVLVTVPNPGGSLVAGLFADGRVITAEHEGLTVPQAAIDARGVRPAVTRLREGRLERVEVEVGLQDTETERVEVRGAVAAGDTVMTGSARDFTPGTPARIGAPAERAASAQ
jgi:RND family efflux transporter MFP subunit